MQTHMAVIMGDLVGSEAIQSPASLHQRFNAAVDQANRQQRANLRSPLTITLGDEFQGLATDLTTALTLTRALRYDLMQHGVDCRFVVGQVQIQTPLNPDKAWNMMGPGLGEARKKLNEKQSGQMYRFSLPGKPVLERLLDSIGAGLSLIEAGWTDQQRQDILDALAGASVKVQADDRGVSRRTIYKVRQAGHFDTYQSHWAAIAATLAELDAPI